MPTGSRGTIRFRPRLLIALLSSVAAITLRGPAAAKDPVDRTVLPVPTAPFGGVVGQTIQDSVPEWPKDVTAPAGAPNVILVLTDDVGFGASGTFGGLIPTPNLDRLAASGLKYNRFNVTAMCSPTRAALLTGRNTHAVGSGSIEDLSTGFPGYWGRIPRSAATVAEILKDNGYNTGLFGKDHNIPGTQQSAAGPYDLWPNGLGFEYFYGFIGGATDQFHPKLYEDTTKVDLSRAPADYILDRDLADHLIRWLHAQKAAAPAKPFFAYYAPGSTHSPQQAPADWIAKFRGKFDQGWDAVREQIFARQKQMGIIPPDAALTLRPPEVPAWTSLSDDQRKVYARFMEVYAGQLAFQDNQFGRILDELQRMGVFEDTLVIFIEGDNGASLEGTPTGRLQEGSEMFNRVVESAADELKALDKLGGPETEELYPSGWGWAMNTPFQWGKEVASHLGGTRDGMVLAWPARIKDAGKLRTQYGHVIDILPTILEAAGVPEPTMVNGAKQQPVDGISLGYSFDTPDAPSRRTEQYYEMLGNRAMYQDGWMASTIPGQVPWLGAPPAGPVLEYRWQLYDLAHDYSQSRDVAAEHPDKLASLRQLWDAAARANNVYPLDNRLAERSTASAGRRASGTGQAVFWGPTSVSALSAPQLFARNFSVTADLEIATARETGVILASGSQFGGWAFYLKDGRPCVTETYSTKPGDQFRIMTDRALGPGVARVRYDFDYDGGGLNKGGLMRISVDGSEIARGRIERTITVAVPFDESFDIGRDTGGPVSSDYADEGAFDGRIEKVSIDLGPLQIPAAAPTK